MKVILKENIKKVGQKGDVVEVSDGHAANFLIPSKKAEFASADAVTRIANALATQSEKETANLSELAGSVKELDGKTATISKPANDKGHLFAAVHEQEVGNAIKDQLKVGLPLDAITLPGEIKATGDYSIVLTAGKVKVNLTLSIQPETKTK